MVADAGGLGCGLSRSGGWLWLAGMIAGFGLGLASGLVGSDALPGKNSRPHWKMCRVCASTGIAFGILAILVYLVFIALLPVIFPLPK